MDSSSWIRFSFFDITGLPKQNPSHLTKQLNPKQGRIKASAGPGAVPNAGPLQTYNQQTTPTNCGHPKLGARVLQHP